MKVFEQIEVVKKVVKDYMKQDHEIALRFSADELVHVEDIATSILCTKWNVGYPGGSFVQAVVDNNLMQAMGRADLINQIALPFYCRLMYNVGKPTILP